MIRREDFRAARLLVVGDLMLDRYWFGDVSRISPEAPVPVVKISHSEDRIGGAGNVARNAAALGAQVTLLSVVGADEAGRTLAQRIAAEPFSARLHEDADYQTTLKLRVIGRQQQLLRIDFEAPPKQEILAAKLKDYESLVGECDVVVLSDYGKGGLAHVASMIELARRRHKPVLVDPKGEDYERYHGATLLTPNRSEFREVAGSWRNEQELALKAEALRAELGLEALLVTRSEEGMTLFRQEQVFHEPTVAREVYDVSGAGDTVIAVLASALAAGSDYHEAVILANRAAGIVVGKLGTAVVSPAELFS